MELDPEMAQTLLDQRDSGKQLLLITNSDYEYTNKVGYRNTAGWGLKENGRLGGIRARARNVGVPPRGMLRRV